MLALFRVGEWVEAGTCLKSMHDKITPEREDRRGKTGEGRPEREDHDESRLEEETKEEKIHEEECERDASRREM